MTKQNVKGKYVGDYNVKVMIPQANGVYHGVVQKGQELDVEKNVWEKEFKTRNDWEKIKKNEKEGDLK